MAWRTVVRCLGYSLTHSLTQQIGLPMFTDSSILARAWRFVTGRVQYNVTKSDYYKQLDTSRFNRIMRNQ